MSQFLSLFSGEAEAPANAPAAVGTRITARPRTGRVEDRRAGLEQPAGGEINFVPSADLEDVGAGFDTTTKNNLLTRAPSYVLDTF